MDKKLLRKRMLEKRSGLSKEEIINKSIVIQEKLFNLGLYQESDFIFSFISFDSEVNTHNIIKDSLALGKRVGVPVIIHKTKKLLISEILDFNKELEMGYYNILSPKKEFIREISPSLIDIVLVPGLIFNPNGFRIGYGGGYYDRLFSENRELLKIGVCFEMQIVSNLPTDEYDIPVDFIITENRLIDCNKQQSKTN